MDRMDVECISGLRGMDHDQMTQPSLNISDVIEVIRTTDPEFAGASTSLYTEPVMDNGRQHMPYVKIVEQPAPKALRFRYECEGRSAGSIPGANSTPENKTFPTIQVVGYKGRAVVVVSCVTKEKPYRPHPHNLVGKEGCKKGVCTMEINSETMSVSFSNLGIQCVKKKDIEDALKVREEIRVDPYRTGFSHRTTPSNIDLNAVRLCFQVFIEGSVKGKFTAHLPPVVSEPIFDKKAMSDLVIHKLSHCSCSAAGGQEVILLCEKVAKEDIQVRFFEEKNGEVCWEAFGDFQPTSVFKQVAIVFRCPSYQRLDIENPVKVFIQLRRGDGASSEPLPFEFVPPDHSFKRKRILSPERSAQTEEPGAHRPILHPGKHAPIGSFPQPHENSRHMAQIKCEPPVMPDDCYPDPKLQYQAYRGVMATPSPQASPSPHSQHGRTPSPLDYQQQGAILYTHNPFMGSASVVQNIPVLQSQNVTVCNALDVNQVYAENNLNSGVQYNNSGLVGMIQPNLRSSIVRTTETYIPNSPYVNLVPQNVPVCPPNISQQLNPVNINNPYMAVNDPSCPPPENNILDLDNQPCATSIGMDSTEFVTLGFCDAALSQNLSNSLTLSDDKSPVERPRRQQETEQENMTDSYTRLTKSTLQDIVTLNSMYKN